MKVYEKISRVLSRYHNCNQTYSDRADEQLKEIEQNLLPSGSGFDAGSEICRDKMNDEKFVILTAYHVMSEHGYYTGWIENIKITVKPAFVGGFDFSVKGRFSDFHDAYGLKDCIEDTIHHILDSEYKEKT